MSPKRPAPARRSPLLLSLLTLLAVAVAIVTGSAAAASAPSLLTAESAVGLRAPLTSAVVRPDPLQPPIQRRAAAFVYDRIAVATGVAAKSVQHVLPTPQVGSTRLQNLVDNLYKGTTNPNRVGNGTTMDAIRNEAATGVPTGGRMHTTKGRETLRGLNNWLRRNPNADSHDRLVAQSLADELSDVLGATR